MSQLKNETVGATFEALVTKDFDSYLLVHPIADLDKIFSSKVNNLYQLMLLKTKENQKLEELKELLLSKLATVTVEGE